MDSFDVVYSSVGVAESGLLYSFPCPGSPTVVLIIWDEWNGAIAAELEYHLAALYYWNDWPIVMWTLQVFAGLDLMVHWLLLIILEIWATIASMYLLLLT